MEESAATLALLLDRVVDGAEARPDAETTGAILEEAARFAARHLAPLAAVADKEGCRLEAGRVRTAAGHAAAWRAYGEAGWAGLTAPEAAGGQELPMALAAAAQELFDAADPAFGMLGINARCATRLLGRHGDAGDAGGLDAAAGRRDMGRDDLHLRAAGGLRCRPRPHAGGAGRRRRLAPDRGEVLDLLRRPRPGGADRPFRARPAARRARGHARPVALPGARHAGERRAQRRGGDAARREARPARLAHLRPRLRGRGRRSDRPAGARLADACSP